MEQNLNDKTACLVTAFQSGDVSAFSTLYDMHINLLFNYGCKLTTDKELLKDCIHDVFVKLYTKKAELGIIDNFKSYLLISLKTSYVMNFADGCSCRNRCWGTESRCSRWWCRTSIFGKGKKLFWKYKSKTFVGSIISAPTWGTYLILYRREEIWRYLYHYGYELPVGTKFDA